MMRNRLRNTQKILFTLNKPVEGEAYGSIECSGSALTRHRRLKPVCFVRYHRPVRLSRIGYHDNQPLGSMGRC